jgi:hypothetical protein
LPHRLLAGRNRQSKIYFIKVYTNGFALKIKVRRRVPIAIGNDVLRKDRCDQNKRQNAVNCEPNQQRYPPMCFAIFACGVSKQSCAVNVIVATHCRLSRARYGIRATCA